jgi:hypothetical protein
MKKDVQIPPQGDARYRTHRSVKCYVAELCCGSKWCTWTFSKSIERVVYLFPGNIEKVVYKNRFYELKPEHEMESNIVEHLNDKGAVQISGTHLTSYEKDRSFHPYPFIDITDNETYTFYQKLRPKWLCSDEYKNT